MQKDRFIFALIIYGIVLLAGAGVCSFLLPGDVFAIANIGTSETQKLPPNVVEPTEGLAPTKEPAQDSAALENEKNDKAPDGNGASENTENREELTGKSGWELLSVETTPEWREVIGERCVVLPKPEAASEEQEILFAFTDMPIERSIVLNIQGCAERKYTYESVERVAAGQYFNEKPAGVQSVEPSEQETVADPLCKMTQTSTLQDDGSYEINIELLLDKTYAYNVYETESHYFVALMEAKEVYDRIVVLDAGHGGWDTGTPSYDGKFLEKNINLQVLLYLEELLKAEDIMVYTTRTTDRNIGHTERIALANSLRADMFISIHCNNAYQNPEAHGTEVLYTQYQNAWEGMNSKQFAQICLEELVTALQLNDRGLFARGDDLTVLQKAEVPAALVELAFMSNAGDMEVLKTDEAQRASAEALYKAIMRAYEMMPEEGLTVTEE